MLHKLMLLNIDYTKVATLDVGGLESLEELYIHMTKITELNLKALKKIKKVSKSEY